MRVMRGCADGRVTVSTVRSCRCIRLDIWVSPLCRGFGRRQVSAGEYVAARRAVRVPEETFGIWYGRRP
jgi:hypothetical protein